MSRSLTRGLGQPSTLGFVDSPELGKAESRTARSRLLKRESVKLGQGRQRTSCSSTLVKRKLSEGDVGTSDTKRRPKMEVPNNPENAVPDAFTKALKEMEDWLEEKLTNNFKRMLAPLQKSIDSLVESKEEWENHKAEVESMRNDQDMMQEKLMKYENITNALVK